VPETGLYREDFAEIIDISDKNLGRIESGRQATSVETLYKISSVLNISIDYLLMGSKGSVQMKDIVIK
jgi:transcriptional regulator with XRE-family HTH domain